MKRPRPKTRRTGCSGCGTLIFFCLAIGAVIGWPIYLDTNGTPASGVITDKVENVGIRYAEWFRRFQIIATYSIPGQPVQHRAICEVDEKTYDSLHRGGAVQMHYFAGLLGQPFLPATHLAPCSTMASISWNPYVMWRAVIAVVSLLIILFLWRVLRIRIAALLLLPWLGWCFASLAVPRIEPEPQHPVAATATIHRVVTVTTLGGMRTHRSIELQHPYQIVVLNFVPPGMDTAVAAVDKVDLGSAPNLKEGQSANIVYDADHPRIARLQQGTRLFPGHAMTTVMLLCLAVVVLVVIGWFVGAFLHLIGRAARR